MRHYSFVVPGVFFLAICALVSGEENWAGYEGGNLHNNSSAVDVNAENLSVAWERRFDHPIECQPDWATSMYNPGMYGARNLVKYGNYLAMVAVPDSSAYPGQKAYVTILNTDNQVVNVIKTIQGYGPKWDQALADNDSGENSCYMEAYDTGIGVIVQQWDPETGILFLRVGGDDTMQTAYRPLFNLGGYTPGGYQTGKGAYEDFCPSGAYSAHQDSEGKTRADKPTPKTGFAYLTADSWQYSSSPWNQTSFFEVDANSGFMVFSPNAHPQASGYFIVNKYTGVIGKKNMGSLGDASWFVEPPDYVDPKPTIPTAFQKWGGIMVGNGRIFFMGPADVGDSDGSSDPGDSKLGNACVQDTPELLAYPDQGLYMWGCDQLSWNDLKPNGGYAGTGAAETARFSAPVFKYRFESTNVPMTDLNDCDSYIETDAFYRNKAWLIDGTGVWAAWKPSRSGNVKLLHCTDSGKNEYDLSVGAGMRGQDIWPHISLATVGANKYIVYFMGNGVYRHHNGLPFTPGQPYSDYSNWSLTTQNPLGPAAISVFDATAGTLKYIYTINAADGSGPYPSLKPNESHGYFDRSQMVVAGKYAYVAWVDSSSPAVTNAQLRLLGFDITAASPSPIEFAYDLGVPKGDCDTACVFDLIAADGVLYALVTLADNPLPGYTKDNLKTTYHVWSSQRIIALHSVAAPDTELPDVAFSSCNLTGTLIDANPPPTVNVGGVNVPLSGVNWSREDVTLTKGVAIPVTGTDASGNTRVVNVVISY